jgi:hypothetical protein
MRLNNIGQIRVIPVDANGQPNGDVFEVTDNLQKIPVTRAVFIDGDGRPIKNFGIFDSNSVDTNNVGFDIWLIAGDSNTKSGVNVDPEFDFSDSRIYQYSRYGNNVYKPILAKEPLNHSDYSNNKIGFALEFAKWYSMTIPVNRKVLLIPFGSNLSGFSNNQWNPTGSLHTQCVDIVNNLDLYGVNKFIGILWHCGISDESLSKSDYTEALDNCIYSFRNNINKAKKSYFLLGELPVNWVNNSNREGIQEAIQETIDRFFNTGVAKSDDLNTESNGYDFDAESQRILGKRYFQAYLFALSNTENIPNPPTEVSFTPDSTSCNISWNGLAQSWIYQYKPISAFDWGIEYSSLFSFINIEDLTPDIEYSFRVKATNTVGQSSWSNSTFKTLFGVSVPNPLLKLTFNSDILSNTGSGSYNISIIDPSADDVYRILDDNIRPNVIWIGGAGSGLSINMSIPSSYTKSLWFRQENDFNPNISILYSPNSILWSPGTDLVFTAGHNNILTIVQNNETHMVKVWYHIVVTYDDLTKKMSMYINGQLKNTAILIDNYLGSSPPLRIGKTDDSVGTNAPGRYDNVQIWGESLTSAQVYQIYLNELL